MLTKEEKNTIEKLDDRDKKTVEKAGQEMVDHGTSKKMETVGSEVYNKGPSPTPSPSQTTQIQR